MEKAMKKTMDHAAAEEALSSLSAEELEKVNGGVAMRSSRLCPVCGDNLTYRYVVFPFHKYEFFCGKCNRTVKADGASQDAL